MTDCEVMNMATASSLRGLSVPASYSRTGAMSELPSKILRFATWLFGAIARKRFPV